MKRAQGGVQKQKASGTPRLRVASWNVNSINSRLDHLHRWTAAAKPDVVLFQELRCEPKDFPYAALKSMGFKYTAVAAKNRRNGVAIAATKPLKNVVDVLPGGIGLREGRFIEAEVADSGLRVASVYAPSRPVDGCHDSFLRKTEFFVALRKRMVEMLGDDPAAARFVIAGDFNITAIGEGSPLGGGDATDPAMQAMHPYLQCGGNVADAYQWTVSGEGRAPSPLKLPSAAKQQAAAPLTFESTTGFTFWGYQDKAWGRGEGSRIDMAFVPMGMLPAEKGRAKAKGNKWALKRCFPDATPRGWSNASDHCPLVVDFK